MPIVKGMSGSFDPRAGVTRARTRALVWGMLTSLIAVLATAPAAAQTVVISQVSGGGGASGAPFRRDFVELHNVGQSAVSLDGLSIQYASPSGLQTFGAFPITPLSGVLPAGAYHLVEMAEGGTVGADLPAPDDVGAVDLNFLSGKVVLVRGVDALLCNGGSSPCDTDASNRIVDLVGYGSANFFEGSGAAPGPPATLGLLRAGDGCTDTNDNLADFAIGTPQPRNHQSPAVTCAAPPPPPPPPPDPCVPTQTIAEVQGNGALSPWLGATLSVSGVVTARLSTGARLGFFLQMPVGDGDATTSDAVFVLTDGDPPLEAMPGNAVCVEGAVTEFVSYDDPRARPLTELLAARVVLVQAGVPLPAPVTLTAADTPAGLGLDGLERFEAMRVRVASLTVVAPTAGVVDPTTGTSASTGVFHGVIAGVARPFREPGVDVHDGPASDGPATVPIFDANLERLRIDTSALGLAPLDVAAGATATEVVGPLWYADRTYTVLPQTTPAVTAVPAAAALPAPRTTEFTTAVLDADGLTDAEASPDYTDVAADPAAIARRLAKLSRHVRAVLQTPDVIGVQSVETLALLQDLATRINADAVAAGQPDPRYQAYLVDGRDGSGLDTGVLVRSSRVSVIDVRQEAGDGLFIDPIMGDPYPLHARPPLVVRATVALSSGPLPVTVIVAHLRRATGMADPFLGVIARMHRAAQVESIAALVQARQAAAPGDPLVVLADVDAPAFNDGYVDVTGTIAGVPVPASAVATATADLVDPNLEDALAGVDGASRYTSTAGGNAQQLLQVLVNGAASDRQSRAFIAHANADYPDALRNDAARAERAGGSDAPVVYFEVPGVAEPPPPPPPGPAEITAQVRVRVWKSHFFWHHRGVTYALVDVTNVSGRTLNGPFQLGIHGLPAGATVLNAKGTVAGLPAVPVTWWRQLKPGRTMRAWVVLKGVPPGLTPKVRVFVGPAKQ